MSKRATDKLKGIEKIMYKVTKRGIRPEEAPDLKRTKISILHKKHITDLF